MGEEEGRLESRKTLPTMKNCAHSNSHDEGRRKWRETLPLMEGCANPNCHDGKRKNMCKRKKEKEETDNPGRDYIKRVGDQRNEV